MPRDDAVRLSNWLLAVCFVLSCSSARAQPLAVHWRAPQGCPSQREVTQSLLALLPAAAARDGARATLDIEITERAEGGFEGRLTVRSAPPAPPRVLQAASCESIAHAAVLIGALTVDAMQTVEVTPPPPRRERPLLRLGLRLTGDLGALPAVSAAPGAIVGVRLDRASLDAGVLGFLPRRARLGADGAQGGVFSLAVGTLRGCYTWLADALALGACAGAELGVLRGVGAHLRQPRSAHGPWSALSAGAMLRHTGPSGLFAELSLEALLALQRPRFEIDALGELFQSRRVLARLSMAAGWTFVNGFSVHEHEGFVEVRVFPNVWSATGRDPGDSAAMTQPRSFEAVYAEYASFVWRIVRGMGVGEQQVQDAVQEVFMVVHRRLPEFDHRFAVKTWLFEIAYRVSCNARRKAARRHEALSEDLHEASPTPEEATDRRRAARVLQELLAQMPDERRLMLVFADLEGLTAPEIAELTGLPLNTVYSRIRRARHELSDALTARGWRRT